MDPAPRKEESQIQAISASKRVSVPGYLDDLSLQRPNSPMRYQIRLIGGARDSATTQDVFANLDRFKSANCEVHAVVTDAKSKADRTRVLTRYAEVFGAEYAARNIRFANFDRKNELNELVDMGGVAIFAAPGGRKRLKADGDHVRAVMVEEGSSLHRLARVDFETTWEMSDPPKASDVASATRSSRPGTSKK